MNFPATGSRLPSTGRSRIRCAPSLTLLVEVGWNPRVFSDKMPPGL